MEFAKKLSSTFSSIYFYCHPIFDIELSHQAVRALQYIQMVGPITIQQMATHLGCAQNTASEIVRRLRKKGLIEKSRRSDDERIVEVNLTEAGKQAVFQHTGLDADQLATQLERLSQNELQQIEQGFALLLKAVGGDFDC